MQPFEHILKWKNVVYRFIFNPVHTDTQSIYMVWLLDENKTSHIFNMLPYKDEWILADGQGEEWVQELIPQLSKAILQHT